MLRLSESDYRSVLDVLREAGAINGPIPFPEPVLDSLRRLVPCDVVAYHEVPDCPGQPRLVYIGEPRGEMSREIRDAMERHRNQNPLTPRARACKFSDFLTQREFHRLGLYQEVSRPLGVEDMMRVWLDPGGHRGARIEFDRAAPAFRERDRAVLDLVRPHLEQFRRQAARRRRASASPADDAELLTAREREIIELVAEGKQNTEVARLLWISPGTVRKHLENAYEKLGVHTRTGAVAALRPGAFTPASRARAG
jgi:DNA-binding CsgD family transcriptional regulator